MDKTALLAPVRDYGGEHADHLPRAPREDEQFSSFAVQRRRAMAIFVFACSMGSLYGI